MTRGDGSAPGTGRTAATDARSPGPVDAAAVVTVDDGALAPVAGLPLVDHVAARLVPVVDEVVVACRPADVEAVRAAVPDARHAVARDATRPLATVEAGLAATDADRVAVVAGDLPFVDPTFVDALFGVLGDADAAVPRRDGAPLATLAAYRRRPALAAVRAAVAAGDGDGPTVPLDRLSTRVVTPAEVAALTGDDTFRTAESPATLETAERRFAWPPSAEPVGDRN